MGTLVAAAPVLFEPEPEPESVPEVVDGRPKGGRAVPTPELALVPGITIVVPELEAVSDKVGALPARVR